MGKGTHVHFCETSKTKYIPRSVIVDTDPFQIDKSISGPLGQLLSPDSFLKGSNSCGNNWGVGHFTDGAEIVDKVMD